MFGKLLKYELKSVGKWYLTLNAPSNYESDYLFKATSFSSLEYF